MIALLVLLIAACVFGVFVASAPDDIALTPVIIMSLIGATIVALLLYLLFPMEAAL